VFLNRVALKRFFQRPGLAKTRRFLRLVVILCAIILAVSIVTTLTVDLGPALREVAETQGSNLIDRPMRIGRLSVLLWRGDFIVEDLYIEGLTPDSRPFLTAGRITLSVPWGALLSQRLVFDAIEMTDWRMYVEMHPDGQHNFIRVTTTDSGGNSNWTTTLQYVRAHRGEFEVDDFGANWSTVARNLDVIVSRPNTEYIGQGKFSDGTVRIADFLPMSADLETTFKIDGSNILFDRIQVDSDGAKSVLSGVADVSRWPEMTYQIDSDIKFPLMREIFFSENQFTLDGDGKFIGSWHIYRGGRELKGMFSSQKLSVNKFHFEDMRGELLWLPDLLDITKASATIYSGGVDFSYRMDLLGESNPGFSKLKFDYAEVELLELTTTFLELQGLHLQGQASGYSDLIWPTGRFSDLNGEGIVQASPPAGVRLMTRDIPQTTILEIENRLLQWGPFSSHRPLEPVAVGGELSYTLSPEWIDLQGTIATPKTWVGFDGRTSYGTRSRIPFSVTSENWQDSDRLLAGVLTAFGLPTSAIPVSGYGSFQGLMSKSFRQPRFEGEFIGEEMRAWDVLWGSLRGKVIIENNYADVRDVVIRSDDSVIYTDGRFSIGYPRRDGGEEIDARVRLERRSVSDLRQAFKIHEYAIEGKLSGEFHLYGAYEHPYGFGRMNIADGSAYGQSFDSAISSMRFEGSGVRLDSIDIRQGSGRGFGAAYIGWDGIYSFNLAGQGLLLEDLSAVSDSPVPLTGIVEFKADGSGSFEEPSYDVSGSIRDIFAGDEGIGQLSAVIAIRDQVLTLKIDAASGRLSVSGAGRIAMTAEMDADLSLSISDTSLDPYIRMFQPGLSPFTSIIGSGQVRVVGELANLEHLVVDTKVSQLDLEFFDYHVGNAAPIQVSLDERVVRISNMRLIGEDTELDIAGNIDLIDEQMAVRVTGTANLGILQGFFRDVRGRGRTSLDATLDGQMFSPVIQGVMTVENGRLRHFAFPHGLEQINGVIPADSRGLSFDGITARLGGGEVSFSGRVEMDGYAPGAFDIGLSGKDMSLRFPEEMRSLVDADLNLTGTMATPTLSGSVFVKSAIYRSQFNASLFDFSVGGGSKAVTSTASFESTIPLRFDVRLLAPSTLRVENDFLRVVATADFQLSGTYSQPLLFGRGELERGEVLFEGRRYLVTRGTIDISNTTQIEPFFDIEAETRVRVPGQTYLVTLRAVGTPERFTPEFNADPPLPEADVIALLLGDVSPGQNVEFAQYNTVITPQQQLLRERATRVLTDVLSSEVGRVVEQTFGVDSFHITPSLGDLYQQSSSISPGARLTIGKRLSDRIYLTYSRSLATTTRDQIILLEYDQSDRLSWVLSQNEDDTYALEVRVRHVF
jgi:hypothetical protein